MSGKSAGQNNRSNGHEVKEYNGPSTVQVQKKSLNWTQNPMLSTTILAQSPCLAGTIWLDLLTVTCMCIICRGHTLCSGSCKLQGGGEELTCTGWQHTLGRDSGIASSTAALCHHYSQCSVQLRTKNVRREREEGGWGDDSSFRDMEIYTWFSKKKERMARVITDNKENKAFLV